MRASKRFRQLWYPRGVPATTFVATVLRREALLLRPHPILQILVIWRIVAGPLLSTPSHSRGRICTWGGFFDTSRRLKILLGEITVFILLAYITSCMFRARDVRGPNFATLDKFVLDVRRHQTIVRVLGDIVKILDGVCLLQQARPTVIKFAVAAGCSIFVEQIFLFLLQLDRMSNTSRQTSICRRTRRAKTIPRPLLARSRQREFRSAGVHFSVIIF